MSYGQQGRDTERPSAHVRPGLYCIQGLCFRAASWLAFGGTEPRGRSAGCAYTQGRGFGPASTAGRHPKMNTFDEIKFLKARKATPAYLRLKAALSWVQSAESRSSCTQTAATAVRAMLLAALARNVYRFAGSIRDNFLGALRL